ncbi:MAG: hypothetical protein S4CHLAM102_00210 [Chlamydiia bacterium]|nr:hypothetical protein [Chlamydiia bacterium]
MESTSPFVNRKIVPFPSIQFPKLTEEELHLLSVQLYELAGDLYHQQIPAYREKLQQLDAVYENSVAAHVEHCGGSYLLPLEESQPTFEQRLPIIQGICGLANLIVGTHWPPYPELDEIDDLFKDSQEL